MNKIIQAKYRKIVLSIHEELLFQENPNRKLIHDLINEALDLYYGV